MLNETSNLISGENFQSEEQKMQQQMNVPIIPLNNTESGPKVKIVLGGLKNNSVTSQAQKPQEARPLVQ